jgi:hypothetical protein
MTTRAMATFEITSWEQSTYDESEGMPTLGRATVGKSFAGDVDGISQAELLMAGRGDEGLAYTGWSA